MRRVLVANRGEIAVRVLRACRALELSTVAVYSDADDAALHTGLADQAVRLGPPPSRESYLSIGALIDAARATGADTVHPGYGFLSENPAFADACREAGLVFVGPSAESIARLGSKLEARRVAEAAGIPVVPGVRPADQSDAGVRAAALAVGFPLLLKASAGGGGKGMRVARHESELDDLMAAARGEARRAFGDDTLYVERHLDRPRHVEVQLMADHHGHVVHLYERDCSVQRRHQKILEESPAPTISAPLRDGMCAAACRLAEAVGYRNAGTVEFLVEGDGEQAQFYFLEMNTRLQVEHPLTEEVCGVDLVRAQLLVANGAPLPWSQDQLGQRGHAVECRIYAEDPASDFLPQAGRLLWYEEPRGPGVRVDSGVRRGDNVSVYYDPLLAKLVVRDESREGALARAAAALDEYEVLGVRTNIPMLRTLVRHDALREARMDVTFIDTHLSSLRPAPRDALAMAAAAAFAVIGPERPAARAAKVSGEVGPGPDPWRDLGGWRL